MKKEIDLSIIILNYNTADLLRQCLLSITKSIIEKYKLEIIVIDNNSSDNSCEMIRREFPFVKLIQNSQNLGFAAGNNIGIKEAKGRYVLLLNPDTQVSPDTLFFMLNYFESHPEVGVATCRVELVSGKLDDACHRGFPTPWNASCHLSGLGKAFPKSSFFNGYHLGYKNINKVHEIDACVGAFMMVRREVGESIGWLDEDYFWYGEDLDFCYQAKSKGWKVMYVPEVKILHWKGAASGMKKESREVSTANSETRQRAIHASTEAMRIFYRKHYLNKYPWILTGLILTGISILERFRLLRTKK